jgi:hypothetical protein
MAWISLKERRSGLPPDFCFGREVAGGHPIQSGLDRGILVVVAEKHDLLASVDGTFQT